MDTPEFTLIKSFYWPLRFLINCAIINEQNFSTWTFSLEWLLPRLMYVGPFSIYKAPCPHHPGQHSTCYTMDTQYLLREWASICFISSSHSSLNFIRGKLISLFHWASLWLLVRLYIFSCFCTNYTSTFENCELISFICLSIKVLVFCFPIFMGSLT